MTFVPLPTMNSAPYYRTEQGEAYLGDSLHLMEELPDKSINLIFTSPPFALTRKKEYGNKSADEYVDWFLGFAHQFHRILADDGSLVVDLGGAYLPGKPVWTMCVRSQVGAERKCRTRGRPHFDS
jgi:DNA modification methylase